LCSIQTNATDGPTKVLPVMTALFIVSKEGKNGARILP
jgi:hypothetical protein